MGTYTDLLKKYFVFKKEEVRDIIITVLILGFMFSFRQWGIEKFDFNAGIQNLVSSILIVALVLLVHVSAQRMLALAKGFQVEYRMWIYGLIVALVICFVTRGYAVLIIPGGIIMFALEGHRLGKWKYQMSQKDLGIVSLMGPISNIILAVFFKILLLISPNHLLLTDALKITLLFAVFTVLPIPKLDGLNIFYMGRATWAMAFAGIAVASLLLYFTSSIILSLVAAVIVGLLGMLLWYALVEY